MITLHIKNELKTLFLDDVFNSRDDVLDRRANIYTGGITANMKDKNDNFITCEFVIRNIENFFSGKCGENSAKEIITHLAFCPHCYGLYMEYAKETGAEMTLLSDVDGFNGMFPEVAKYGITNPSKNTFYTISTEDESDKYSRAAVTMNLDVLLHVQAFKDMVDIDYENDKEGNKSYKDFTVYADEFTKFLTLKTCQKIDHLEKCLAASKGE